jgi:hypothetical protein
LVVDEVPGLALALARPAATVALRVRISGGDELQMRILLPDLHSALCIKALAYRGRYADKDAVDLWRLINAAHAAGLTADAWPATPTGQDAADTLHRFFGRSGGAGLRQATRQASEHTHMRAIIQAVVPRP